MMVAEEEALKKRLMVSIETCRNEMAKLCMELQLPRFEVGTTKTSHQKVLDCKMRDPLAHIVNGCWAIGDKCDNF